jgi:NDP-sugar pyrophosphorylase family protein
MSSKKINHAFIMAAGRGTRLRPLTKKIPKGLIKFKQTSLIANGIKKLKKYIDFIHISVGYKGPIEKKILFKDYQ